MKSFISSECLHPVSLINQLTILDINVLNFEKRAPPFTLHMRRNKILFCYLCSCTSLASSPRPLSPKEAFTLLFKGLWRRLALASSPGRFSPGQKVGLVLIAYTFLCAYANVLLNLNETFTVLFYDRKLKL